MATVAEIAVNITARTQKLEKDLQRAKDKLSKVGQSAKTSGSALGGWAKRALGAAAAGYGIYTVLRSISTAMDEIDAAAKQGRAIGMTTQQILQLNHAAKLAGVGATQLKTGLARMTVGVQDAARGTGEARLALEAMGVNVQQLAAQSPHEQFMTIADAISRIADPAQKADAAYKMFGRSGIDLINMLNGGSASLAAQAAEFDKLNGKISDVDASAIEAANDAITDMKTAFKAVWQQLAIALAPTLQAVAKLFQDVAEWVRSVAERAKSMGVRFSRIVPIVVKMIAIFVAMKIATIALVAAKAALLAMSGPAGWAQLAVGVALAAGAYATIKNELGGAVKETKNLTGATQQQVEATEQQTKAADDLKKKQGELARQQQALIAAGKQVTDQFKVPQENLSERLAHLHKLVQAGAISWQTYGRAVKGAITDFKSASKAQQQQAAKPIAAVTMGSSAGFSALQKANREQQRQTRLHEQEVELQQQTNRILNGVRTDITNSAPEVANI
jgi:hypothetical protein